MNRILLWLTLITQLLPKLYLHKESMNLVNCPKSSLMGQFFTISSVLRLKQTRNSVETSTIELSQTMRKLHNPLRTRKRSLFMRTLHLINVDDRRQTWHRAGWQLIKSSEPNITLGQFALRITKPIWTWTWVTQAMRWIRRTIAPATIPLIQLLDLIFDSTLGLQNDIQVAVLCQSHLLQPRLWRLRYCDRV